MRTKTGNKSKRNEDSLILPQMIQYASGENQRLNTERSYIRPEKKVHSSHS